VKTNVGSQKCLLLKGILRGYFAHMMWYDCWELKCMNYGYNVSKLSINKVICMFSKTHKRKTLVLLRTKIV